MKKNFYFKITILSLVIFSFFLVFYGKDRIFAFQETPVMCQTDAEDSNELQIPIGQAVDQAINLTYRIVHQTNLLIDAERIKIGSALAIADFINEYYRAENCIPKCEERIVGVYRKCDEACEEEDGWYSCNICFEQDGEDCQLTIVDDIIYQCCCMNQIICEAEMCEDPLGWHQGQSPSPGWTVPQEEGLSWPLEDYRRRITQCYGYTNYARGRYGGTSFHNGIDVSVPTGENVFSSANGIVLRIGDFGEVSYGKWVVVYHPGHNLSTLYAHLDDFRVAEGDEVLQGQVIGLAGDTGNSDGSHLHYTVFIGRASFSDTGRPTGTHDNPCNYVDCGSYCN